MAYTLENALYQWDEGERRVREAPEPARADLERAVDAVLDELRKRLGSTFVVDELADFYASGTDWAADVAQRRAAGSEASHVVDAAFKRYAREASNYAGGRAREKHERPDRPG
jgi:GTP1/Obg family GTP-binding protein